MVQSGGIKSRSDRAIQNVGPFSPHEIDRWTNVLIVSYILGASRLVALAKLAEGVRPIAIGEVIYRLVGRSACF